MSLMGLPLNTEFFYFSGEQFGDLWILYLLFVDDTALLTVSKGVIHCQVCSIWKEDLCLCGHQKGWFLPPCYRTVAFLSSTIFSSQEITKLVPLLSWTAKLLIYWRAFFMTLNCGHDLRVVTEIRS